MDQETAKSDQQFSLGRRGASSGLPGSENTVEFSEKI
jgi:hypothetical protein